MEPIPVFLGEGKPECPYRGAVNAIEASVLDGAGRASSDVLTEAVEYDLSGVAKRADGLGIKVTEFDAELFGSHHG